MTWDNLVVFERDEGLRHEKECLVGDTPPEELWGEETASLVNKRIALERETRDYRIL